jgi:hypothetical protein
MVLAREFVEVFFAVTISFIMAMAEPDQSGSLSVFRGLRAALDKASTVDFLLSHSSELGETATTRLPSLDATASSTVLGWGSVERNRSEAHFSADTLLLNEER